MRKTLRRIGYLYFSQYYEPLLKKGFFYGLETHLKRAGMDVSLGAYIGELIVAVLLASIIPFPLVLILSFLLFNHILLSFLLSVVISLFSGVSMLLYYYYWPQMKAKDRKVEIEKELAGVASYMSAMASSGVPPGRIFISLAKEKNLSPAISKEAQRITRDLQVFGMDILRALTQAARRSPSVRLAAFFEGINATIMSGGDLKFYLASEAKALMKEQEERTKEFIDRLGVVAEMFMVLGVVAPLFFVVILAIIAVIIPAEPGSSQEFIIKTIFPTIVYILMPTLLLATLMFVDIMEQ